MPSTSFGSRPCALSATCDDAPQLTSSLPFAVSRKKQVLNRPPEPKASPDPMIVRRMVKPMHCAGQQCQFGSRWRAAMLVAISAMVSAGSMENLLRWDCGRYGDRPPVGEVYCRGCGGA